MSVMENVGGLRCLVPPRATFPQPIRTQMQFMQYDPEGRGWITRQNVWEDSELSALPQSRSKVGDAFKRFSTHSDRVS